MLISRSFFLLTTWGQCDKKWPLEPAWHLETDMAEEDLVRRAVLSASSSKPLIAFVLRVRSDTKLCWYRVLSNNSVFRSLCQALGQYTRAKKASEQWNGETAGKREGGLHRLSPVPKRFLRNFSRSAFPTILESATGYLFRKTKWDFMGI